MRRTGAENPTARLRRAGTGSAHAIEAVAFDADDTLWHNERVFRLTQERFAELLADHAEPSDLRAQLDAAERRNLGRYGFGVKGFVLSMIETALEITDSRVPGAVIGQLIDAGHEMLDHPIELLPDVLETVEGIAAERKVLLITKGDLLDQERKLAQSGLGELFHGVEVVSDKTAATYARVFARYGIATGRAVMVGNSLRSDVAPALEAGAWAVHVPHELTWSYEHDVVPQGHTRFRTIARLGELPALIETL